MAAVVLGFFADKFLGTECTLEAETSVSNLTQYKLFIGVDKKKMLSGLTFSFNNTKNSDNEKDNANGNSHSHGHGHGHGNGNGNVNGNGNSNDNNEELDIEKIYI